MTTLSCTKLLVFLSLIVVVMSIEQECTPESCHGKGKCVKPPGNHVRIQCGCDPEVGGDACNSNCDGCTPHPCGNGSTCICKKDAPYFECVCAKGRGGRLCEIVKPCENNPCQHGGICREVTVGEGFDCFCKDGRYGKFCEKENPCSSSPCEPGNTCTAFGAMFMCS